MTPGTSQRTVRVPPDLTPEQQVDWLLVNVVDVAVDDANRAELTRAMTQGGDRFDHALYDAAMIDIYRQQAEARENMRDRMLAALREANP